MKTIAWIAVLGLAAPGFAAVVSDDFNDNTRGPLWSETEDPPGNMLITETNGRLEGQSTTTALPHEDAIYLSDGPGGFAVSTASDFQAKVDYTVIDIDGAANALSRVALQFGVGTDPSGDNSAAIVVGIGSVAGNPVPVLGTATRTGNVDDSPILLPGATLTGTLYISYAAATDVLHLSAVGYGAGGNSYPGLVQGAWGADDLLIGIGFRGGGVALGPGDAWFDNFELTTGAIPEPASAGVFLVGAAGLVRRRRDR
jgi:hypothetical protein